MVWGCSPGLSNEPLCGWWEGRLEFPGLKMTISLRISQAADNRLEAVLVRPDFSTDEVGVTDTF